mmetsp:Transcript_15737/g.17766  ORF Transcript_15737/g.17766 Transcript_15737/m.17766 type:complete len:148 (-) Transcript_15737:219-662(-)
MATMMSYFKVFVQVIFPVPVILLGLLLLPLPISVHKGVISLTDSILFLRPHPHIHISLFWLCFGVSVVTLFSSYQAYNDNKEVYYSVKHSGGHQSPALTKLMAAERNVWISLAASVLWLLLHRYRSLMKRCFRAEDFVAADASKKVK